MYTPYHFSRTYGTTEGSWWACRVPVGPYVPWAENLGAEVFLHGLSKNDVFRGWGEGVASMCEFFGLPAPALRRPCTSDCLVKTTHQYFIPTCASLLASRRLHFRKYFLINMNIIIHFQYTWRWLNYLSEYFSFFCTFCGVSILRPNNQHPHIYVWQDDLDPSLYWIFFFVYYCNRYIYFTPFFFV